MNDKCPIWGTQCKKLNLIKLSGNKYVWDVDSPRAGGKYRISDTAYGEMGMAIPLEESSKVKLSRRIYEQNRIYKKNQLEKSELPEIDLNTLREVNDWPMPSVPKRTEYCLQFLASKTKALGEAINMDSHLDEMQAAALLKNAGEARYLIEEFRNEDWIKIKPSAKSDSGLVVIRLKGYLQLEELKKTNLTSE